VDYSNLGLAMLGHVLARKAGKSYDQLVRERITEPLGLKDTAQLLGPEQKARLATGHNEKGQPVPNWDFDVFAGAGALRSTAGDVLRFLGAQAGLVETKLAKAMRATQEKRHPAGGGTHIGLGWFTRTSPKDRQVWWHNGGTGGYTSFAGFTRDPAVAVVVLCNTCLEDGLDVAIDGLGAELLRQLIRAGKQSG
jgi:CubicO group peptidase (beta-lactamase class C family)